MNPFKTVILILGIFTKFTLPLLSQNQIEIDSVIGFDRNAIHINYAGGDGVHIGSSRFNGVNVDSAGFDGIHVRHANLFSMYIQGDKSASTLQGHIGLIKNRNSGTSPDVLALQVGNQPNPGAGCNFLTFYNGLNNIIGEVQGNGNGGVSYTSPGSDYAEYLPVLDQSEIFQPGDVVGIYHGHISKQTKNADRVMVITDQAAVLGNSPVHKSDDIAIHTHETVSFVGQVQTSVLGPVHSGDWIVASGNGDGLGIAVNTSDIKLYHQIIGQAWESSTLNGIKRINTAVGINHMAAWTQLIRSQQSQIDDLKEMIMALTVPQPAGSND